MLPPIVTKTFEHLTSVVIDFAIIMIGGTFAALLLAWLFGGKSPVMRKAIFSILSFGSICAAVYFAMSKLNGGA